MAAIVSDPSNMPQNDVATCLGLDIMAALAKAVHKLCAESPGYAQPGQHKSKSAKREVTGIGCITQRFTAHPGGAYPDQ